MVSVTPAGIVETSLNGTAVELVVEPTVSKEGATAVAVAAELGPDVATCISKREH